MIGKSGTGYLVNLTTVCTGAGGQVVCSGEALVLVRDLERES
ncbi:MAG TPA: hypothetical protein VLC95_02560 [Anaerolineae bacterium]|nr:hypothetical protein [Anaerolineae bacterium]